MSDKSSDERKREPRAKDKAKSREERRRERGVYLIPYPKIIFFYPTFLTAVVLAIWMALTKRFDLQVNDITAAAMTWVFLGILSLNLGIITFDFPRTTSLTMFFLIAAIVLGAVLLFTFHPGLLPALASTLAAIRPLANATFFAVISVVLAVIYIGVFINVRFNYWEVRPNELLHHHGILSDLERFSAPHLRVDKEINDIFEYLLLRSGRLILQPSNERRAVILDNVPFISDKEREITRMLGALQVQVRDKAK